MRPNGVLLIKRNTNGGGRRQTIEMRQHRFLPYLAVWRCVSGAAVWVCARSSGWGTWSRQRAAPAVRAGEPSRAGRRRWTLRGAGTWLRTGSASRASKCRSPPRAICPNRCWNAGPRPVASTAASSSAPPSHCPTWWRPWSRYSSRPWRYKIWTNFYLSHLIQSE